ncbi:MAG: lytic transglycosylase domain-containing protein, partial [Bacteroidota bacterium]|nr:lytic transglycosylase domain-containing protein [Bacteroidota bacterium]
MKQWTYLFVVLTLAFMVSVNAFGKGRHSRSQKHVTTHHVTSVKKKRAEPAISSNTFTKKFQIEPIEDPFSQKIDELISSWYVKSAFDMDTTRLSKAEIKSLNVPDSVIVRRLQSIPSPVPLSFNPVVKKNIMYYLQHIRWKTEVMIGLSKFYFPIIEEIFDRYELPQELKYLTIIESALNPRAVSPVGACGMWQLMYGTGKQNGLEINSYVDERRDIVKSTEAAAKYLKRLHDIFNDWHLVIAAYNCGPGNIQKAIARNGGSQDYWKIYYSLPQATRDYVPAYIAAAYVFHYYQSHQL